ncbi:putative protein-tyrosine-phosphatase [Gordonia hirsuta DSM 44140 = NBRC 16056]|uniref:Tyrosine specific protein phosphatases domain-containing protein n=1 Tax=Gordonia hirsuta DSM 44140 = NBRC 16056 TaxID=1121927 RepID=L7LA98_9ACTN|nr:tyrosine-protein phosphatase [Gordonia hirsuta]GAC56967.1 putative protein-tyrosine-phosphatase [Gordonia hirsuta DSM 44140 = NBRC 16056]
MTDALLLPAPSPIAALPNLRDLGGWAGADGRPVRPGRVFRSTDFRAVDGQAQQQLSRLGLRTIYDLRSAAERQALPDPALDGVAGIALDVLADDRDAIPADFLQLFADPAVVAHLDADAGGKAADLMAGVYRRFVSTDSARSAYRRLYLGLLGADRGPALFHCTTGKDRTGWAAASFLSLMGVDRDDVYRDYLETNERLLPALTPVFDAFAAAGGDPEVLRPLLGVQRDYLDAAFDEMASTYGNVTGYFARGLGIDADAQGRLRDGYLLG